MPDGNNKLNAELRKVEDDLFASEDFSPRDPVPLDDVVKPLPVPDEDLNPVAAGFVPVKEEVAHALPEESVPAIRTFSETRPLSKHDVFSEPLKAVESPPSSAPEKKNAVSLRDEPLSPTPLPEEKKFSAPQPPPVRKPVSDPVSVPPASFGARQIAVPDADHASLGAILRQARNAAGLTAEQAADVTKIRLDYIVGIENDDFKRLPPVVFIRAYARTLAGLYKLDQRTLDLILQKVNELDAPADVPEQLLQKLEKDVQVSEEETRKLKRMILYAGLIVALIISLTITCIVAAAIGRSRSSVQTSAPVQPSLPQAIQTSDLEKLLPQQMPEIKVLEVPQQK